MGRGYQAVGLFPIPAGAAVVRLELAAPRDQELADRGIDAQAQPQQHHVHPVEQPRPAVQKPPDAEVAIEQLCDFFSRARLLDLV